ncbi:MAG: thiamine pyrophosphate-dependent enzyme [Chloroflexi bacterium]|nr:thiamine pyrophosphate-dependent enzyme [Chloroflexota bacterium]
MAEIDGGHLFAKALKREGVEYVFTLNGGHIYNLYEGCVDEGIKVIDFRHEQVAAHAAEGWAKVTGKPGVGIVTAGPGVTDAVTGIANAFQAPSPMVMIGGNAGIGDHLRGGLQDFDSASFLKPITKFSEQVKRVERIPEYMSIAFRHATSGVPGPSYLEIPIDVVNGRTDEEKVRYPQTYRTESKAYGDPEYIARVVEILKQSQRPMVLAGSDVWWCDAARELREFIEMIDAPVFLNAMGRGSIPSDHPNLGSLGRRYGLVKSDTVVLIGTPIDFRLSYGADSIFPQKPKLVEIMMDGSKIGQNRDIDAGVVGDTKAILQQIMDELRRSRYKSPGRSWVEEVMTEDRALEAQDDSMLNSDQTPIHPMRLMKELRDFLDRDATVVGDGGDIVTFAARVLNINEPGHWLDPGQFGCLGAGSGFAAAAQLARPGKQVCIVYGDGAFGLTGFDVETYVRFKLPIVSVLGNNGAWNQTTQGVVRRGMRGIGTYLSQETNYAKIMEGMGGHSERVTDPNEIRPALERAFNSGKPALLDVVTDPNMAYAAMGGRSRQQRQY